jgi:hypothetical protein
MHQDINYISIRHTPRNHQQQQQQTNKPPSNRLNITQYYSIYYFFVRFNLIGSTHECFRFGLGKTNKIEE